MTIKDVAWMRRLFASGGARALREAAGLSVREVAAELGVDPTTLWRWERGLRRPRRELAERAATVYAQLAGGRG
jgi:transcriptional regulator with XRE-family HTH domain